MSDTYITTNEQVYEAAELIGKAKEIYEKNGYVVNMLMVKGGTAMSV
jgi:hypothetical protein